MKTRRFSWRAGLAGACAGLLVLGSVSSCADASHRGGGRPGADATHEGAFTILSYNVAGLPAEVSEAHPDRNLPLISPLLNGFDLVATQEDFDWWPDGGLASTLDFVHYHDRLRADADHAYRSPRHPGLSALEHERPMQPETGDGLGFLSRLPMSGNDRIPWTSCFGGFDVTDGGEADCMAMKGFSRAEVELVPGSTVDVYNVHGEAGGTDADRALRADDFDQLASYIREHSTGRPLIVVGDTNLSSTDGGADEDTWATFLRRTGLTDSCAAVRCERPGRIDKVAIRSGGDTTLEVTGHRFLRAPFVDGRGRPLSDHEPLEVTVRWSSR